MEVKDPKHQYLLHDWSGAKGVTDGVAAASAQFDIAVLVVSTIDGVRGLPERPVLSTSLLL